MARRRRIAVALLFTAAGITPMVALGSAWGGQGFTASTTVTAEGRTAKTFPVKATEATTVPAAGVPQVIQPPAAAPAESAPAVEKAAAPPSPARTAKPSRTPKSAPPSVAPSTSQTTGN